MAQRSKAILSPGQRAVLFVPSPTNRETIERIYALGVDDMTLLARRRRPENRLGCAVQLCYLRYPGRALLPQEPPLVEILKILSGQLGCRVNDFTAYAARPTTLREYRSEIERYLGLRSFGRNDLRNMLLLGIEGTTSTDRGMVIVTGMVERLRLDRIVLLTADTLERIALIARIRARPAACSGLIAAFTLDQSRRRLSI